MPTPGTESPSSRTVHGSSPASAAQGVQDDLRILRVTVDGDKPSGIDRPVTGPVPPRPQKGTVGGDVRLPVGETVLSADDVYAPVGESVETLGGVDQLGEGRLFLPAHS